MKFLLIFLFAIPINLYCQHTPVFPNLDGEELLSAIRENYTPSNTLGYTNARDTLFRNILATNNQLKCLYTDWTITLDPNLDPSDNAYSQKVNTEHIYPQSKGAKVEPMRSNMYNLYPVRENVNTDRSNDPFGDIDDNQTQWWYYQDIKQSSKPTTDIDLYSEKANGIFEPRENKKGDVARSVMYFYTIYTQECNNLDPNYFISMASDLCKWHYQDAVDMEEWNKNVLIAAYQEQKSNPFILDCTIPERTYCGSLGYKCTTTNNIIPDISYRKLNLSPNTGTSGTLIKLDINPDENLLLILDNKGRQLDSVEVHPGQTINLDHYNPGIYYLILKNEKGYLTGGGRYIRL